MILNTTHRHAQEREFRGYTWFQNGIQGPNVAVRTGAWFLITKQEQPGHPLPFYRPGIQGPNVAVVTSAWQIVTVREQPRHPDPTLRHNLFPAATIVVNNGDKLIMKQEQPFQALWPPPPLRSGWATEGESAYGYILGIG